MLHVMGGVTRTFNCSIVFNVVFWCVYVVVVVVFEWFCFVSHKVCYIQSSFLTDILFNCVRLPIFVRPCD